MSPPHRPPSLLLSTAPPAQPLPSSSRLPAQSSSSPFRYIHFPEQQSQHQQPRALADPLQAAAASSSSSSSSSSTAAAGLDHPLAPSPRASPPTAASRLQPARAASPAPPPKPRPQHLPPRRTNPRRALQPPPQPLAPRATCRISDRAKPWLGFGSWVATSVGFLLAIAFWKDEVFTGLDHLALYLQSLGQTGYAILFCLIFITTIPPFPLYSTLIVLSGYTFGTWTGAAISYCAALSGALAVFVLARLYLRDSIARLLAHTAALQRAVRAIERRPRLLLLIRVAPYPYNLMNVLLAASRTLSFRTYAACTALSLVKVVVHTSIGASIHSFARYHRVGDGGGEADDSDDGEDRTTARAWTAAGVVLCIVAFVYLMRVARRAVDEELEAEAGGGEGRATAAADGEDVWFFSARDEEEAVASEGVVVAEMRER